MRWVSIDNDDHDDDDDDDDDGDDDDDVLQNFPSSVSSLLLYGL